MMCPSCQQRPAAGDRKYCWPCMGQLRGIDQRISPEHVELVQDLLGIAQDETNGYLIADTVGLLLLAYLAGRHFEPQSPDCRRVGAAAKFIESDIDVVLLRKILIMIIGVPDAYIGQIYL